MIQKTAIEGLLIQTPGEKFSDERGSFRESWYRRELEEALGKSWVHVQENIAISKKGVLRGIHVAPWNKLVHVSFGEVLAVIIDLRKGSHTFKRFEKITLSEENGIRLFIPEGLGNSYLILSEEAIYEYSVDKYFLEEKEKNNLEKGILWNDPDLGIDWPITDPILSDKDKQTPPLREFLQ